MGKKLSELPKKPTLTVSATYIAGFDSGLSTTYVFPASTFQTSVWSQSANYNIDKISPIYTNVIANSSNWNTTFTNFSTNSANYSSVYTNVNNNSGLYATKSDKGIANGYASLSSDGRIPFSQKSRRQRISVESLSGSYVTDVSLADEFDILTTGNLTLENPISSYHGQLCVWTVKFGGVHSVSLGNQFRTGNTITWAMSANRFDKMGATYNGTDIKWDIVSFVANFPG